MSHGTLVQREKQLEYEYSPSSKFPSGIAPFRVLGSGSEGREARLDWSRSRRYRRILTNENKQDQNQTGTARNGRERSRSPKTSWAPAKWKENPGARAFACRYWHKAESAGPSHPLIGKQLCPGEGTRTPKDCSTRSYDGVPPDSNPGSNQPIEDRHQDGQQKLFPEFWPLFEGDDQQRPANTERCRRQV